jgi:membrane-associated protease RseP (regulator of RpoE activity)
VKLHGLKLITVAACLGVMASCQSATLITVPEPLAESLPWSALRQAGAFLGLQTRENDSGSLDDLFFSPGVRVVRVIENSPAEDAGFLPGDVLLKFDGEDVNDPGALEGMLASRKAETNVDLTARRDDSVYDVNVQLVAAGKRPLAEPELLYRLDAARTGAGWATDVGGVRLVSAHEASPVFEAGLELGSLVTKLDGTPVHSDRDLIRRLVVIAPGSTVELDFVSQAGEPGQAKLELLDSPSYTAGFNIPILFYYSHDPNRSTTAFSFLDLWIISLFGYERDGLEQTWTFLRFFSFSRGLGELSE